MLVLIADDEPIHLFLLELFLKKWNYEVLRANNGDEAWQILQNENRPEIAILDWDMPGLSGVEVCRKVRGSVAQTYTYLVLLSARSQKTDIQKGLEAGADAYITKPYNPEEIQKCMETGAEVIHSNDRTALVWR